MSTGSPLPKASRRSLSGHTNNLPSLSGLLVFPFPMFHSQPGFLPASGPLCPLAHTFTPLCLCADCCLCPGDPLPSFLPEEWSLHPDPAHVHFIPGDLRSLPGGRVGHFFFWHLQDLPCAPVMVLPCYTAISYFCDCCPHTPELLGDRKPAL